MVSCMKCGLEFTKDSGKFCRKCGTRRPSEPQPPAEEPSSPPTETKRAPTSIPRNAESQSTAPKEVSKPKEEPPKDVTVANAQNGDLEESSKGPSQLTSTSKPQSSTSEQPAPVQQVHKNPDAAEAESGSVGSGGAESVSTIAAGSLSPAQANSLKRMQAVRQLLEEADLQHYLELFEKARLDDECLRHLDEEDLEKVGISIGAHRKRLMELVSEKYQSKSTNATGSFGGSADGAGLMTLKPDGITPEMLETTNASDFEGWRQGPLLGKGSYGAVYIGMTKDGSFYAVKKTELGGVQGIKPSELVVLSREITMMRRLKQRNVCGFAGSRYDSNENSILMFMEYVSGGSLSSIVKKFKPLPEDLLKNWVIQLLKGLAYLHSQNIIHRDIKGDNVLVDMSPAEPGAAIKLADFGAAKRLGDAVGQSKTVVGTPYWMAPEVVMSTEGYDAKADIWSVGCTVAEMITGRPPWPQKANLPAAVLMIATSTDGPTEIPTEGVTPECRKFMDACFTRDPAARPSSRDLLEHEWLAGHPMLEEPSDV